MSEASDGVQPHNQCAPDVEECAAAWVMERHGETWSDADQEKLDSWFAASPANLVAFWRLEAALDRTHRLRALSTAPRSSARAFWLKLHRVTVATFIGIIVFAIMIATYLLYSPETVYTTPVGGRETITLADGSRIELNTDTILRTKIGIYRSTVCLD
jgi:transmembrane sensor